MLLDPEVHQNTVRESSDSLIGFVDKLFSLRDHSDIQRFQIRSGHMIITISCAHVHRWIASAVSLNVQELCINMRGHFEIPSCLATCKSLSKLELVLFQEASNHDKKRIFVPTSVSLPQLKSLRLSLWSLRGSLAFDDDENWMTKFFSSCPALQSLQLSWDFRNMKLIVSLPQLKHFRYLQLKGGDSIQLCAPNLKFLDFHGCISSDYVLENLASLTSADIFMCEEYSVTNQHWKISAEKKGLYANKMMKLLRELYNVKDLRLSECILKALGGVPNMLSSQTYQFYNNLRTLKLRTWLTRGCLHSITYLLRISPHIESLSLELFESPLDIQCRRGGYLDFDKVTYDDSEMPGNNREAWLLSPRMIDHLKFTTIRGIRGCLNELKLLEFLLTNATALEKLILTPCSRYSKQDMLTKLHEKLLTYPRASKGTNIMFESE